jgi:hypothetical protein
MSLELLRAGSSSQTQHTSSIEDHAHNTHTIKKLILEAVSVEQLVPNSQEAFPKVLDVVASGAGHE